MPGPRKTPPDVWLWSRMTKDGPDFIDKDGLNRGPCWLWTGCTVGKGYRDGKGYGSVRVDHHDERAHRVAYELVVGPIPAGLVLDHLCRVHLCCNPAHLEPVTHAVNIRRGEGIPAVRARATHCVNGHPFDGDNTAFHVKGGRTFRRCRACHRIRDRQRLARLRGEVVA